MNTLREIIPGNRVFWRLLLKRVLLVWGLLIGGLVTCGLRSLSVNAQSVSDTSPVHAVATTGMLGDVVSAVGGEHAQVSVLMKPECQFSDKPFF